jgi:hypothetical protein
MTDSVIFLQKFLTKDEIRALAAWMSRGADRTILHTGIGALGKGIICAATSIVNTVPPIVKFSGCMFLTDGDEIKNPVGLS